MHALASRYACRRLLGLAQVLAPFAVAATIALAASSANAATLAVSSTLDDGSPGTLRSQVAAAASGDTIAFDPTLFAQPRTITLTQGEIGIAKSLSIEGPASTCTVSGNSASRIFNISQGSVSIARLTLSNGRIVGAPGVDATRSGAAAGPGGAGQGGAIWNGGTLALSDVVLSNNQAVGGAAGRGIGFTKGATRGGAGGAAQGGALFNAGTLSLSNVSISNNRATGAVGGSGSYSFGPNFTFIPNSPGQPGGAAQGGGLYNSGALSLGPVTWSGNTVVGGAGGPGTTAGLAGVAQGPDIFDTAANADRTPPALAITSPAANIFAKLIPTVSGTVSDEGTGGSATGVSRVDLVIRRLSDNRRWNGSAWVDIETGLRATISGANWSVSSGLPSGANLLEGAYELKAVAYDVARNVSGRVQRITIDKTGPSVAITSHTSGATVADLSGFAGTASDSSGGAGLAGVTLVIIRLSDGARWNGWVWKQGFTGIPTQVSAPNWQMVVPASNGARLPTGLNLPDGQYQVVADGFDAAGNYSQAAVTVTKGSSASALKLARPSIRTS
jgi:hypothetical protein